MFNLSISSIIAFLAILAVPFFSATIMFGWFVSKNKFPVDGRTVLITGASQGLGLSAAKQLSSKGANIIIVSRDKKKLQLAITEITSSAKSPSQKFLHLSYDLTKEASATKILAEAVKWNNGQPPDIVWNIAGMSHPAFFADAPISTLHSQMDTVYWSCAYMAHATLNLWKQPVSSSIKLSDMPARHLIFTSSVVALFPIAGYSPYTPAKAAMRGLADSLAQEVEVYNGSRHPSSPHHASAPVADMKIHIIYPMGISSPGFEQENTIKPELTLQLEKDDVPQDPDTVAKTCIEALERGEYMITTLFLGHLIKGAAFGASVRSTILDYFWQFLGGIVILFVTPDFMAKCRNWGRERGAEATGKKAQAKGV